MKISHLTRDPGLRSEWQTCLVGLRYVANASRKAADIKEMLKMKVAPDG
jgi:hypothetical protein